MSVRHYVNPEPFDPAEVERLTPEQERFYTASQWQLMWWKFRRHRLAVISGWFLLLMYGSILISEFIAPYNLHTRHADFIYSPPQAGPPVPRRPASSARSSTASTSSSTWRT